MRSVGFTSSSGAEFGAAEAPGDPRLRRRALRVFLAVAFIATISVADLYLTLLYARSIGFSEGNPLARWVMQMGCPWLLSIWKIALVAVTCGIFIYCRHKRSGELGAWLGAAVMIWLALQWSQYAAAAPALTPVLHEVAQWNPTWVQMNP